jgi:hypothetical protein
MINWCDGRQTQMARWHTISCLRDSIALAIRPAIQWWNDRTLDW